MGGACVSRIDRYAPRPLEVIAEPSIEIDQLLTDQERDQAAERQEGRERHADLARAGAVARDQREPDDRPGEKGDRQRRDRPSVPR